MRRRSYYVMDRKRLCFLNEDEPMDNHIDAIDWLDIYVKANNKQKELDAHNYIIVGIYDNHEDDVWVVEYKGKYVMFNKEKDAYMFMNTCGVKGMNVYKKTVYDSFEHAVSEAYGWLFDKKEQAHD